jgi:hypothetical protein
MVALQHFIYNELFFRNVMKICLERTENKDEFYLSRSWNAFINSLKEGETVVSPKAR